MAGSRFTPPAPVSRLRLDHTLRGARSPLTWNQLRASLRLREGWTTVFLAALMVLVVQFAITRAGWAAELSILPSVTYLGLLTGFILAKIPLRNWVGQITGFAVGLVAIWLRTLAVIDGRYGGFRGKSIELAHRLGHYARATFVEGSAEDDLFLFVLVMAFLSFALAFLTMWWVLRSHWISPAIGLCGLTLLVNLGYDREDSKAFLALFLLVVIPLTIRFNAARNEWQWQSADIAYPTSMSWRFMSVASGITLGLLFVSYLVPFSVHTGPINAAWERVAAPWTGFENRFEQFFPSVGGRGRTRNTFPGFAAFGESFQLGGGLNLPDDPAVALKCDGSIFAQYVKMNTYDFYTGHGFKKKPVDVTAQQADGNLYDPRVDQVAGKSLPLPAAADQTARVNTCTADLYRPRGNLLPVLGTQLQQTDIDARLSLGWQIFTPAGVHVPPLPGETAPPQLADLIKQADALNGLMVPTDAPPTLRPGAPPQVTLQRDGTLVIYVPKGTAPMLSPEQYAAVVTRAQTASAPVSAPAATTTMTGGSGGTKPPPINRVVVVEAPVIAPTVTATAGPVGIASAVRSTPTAVPTVTPAPVTMTQLDKRLDAITQEQTRLSSSLIQTQVVIEGGKIAAILYRGQAPNYGDIEQVMSKSPVPVGKQVTEDARVSEATEDDLRAVAPMPPSVPKWSTRYLQLPDSITQRTADLAEQLGRNVPTAYDYAGAVDQYLRTNMTYAEKVALPPYDRDATDYFLFQSKQGYCEYFSTAMVTLMRLGGVPAREVVGYLPGAKSEDGRYISRESQAHAWVEVWFPRYGWIPYDPTPRPGIAPLVRGPQPVEKAPDPQANPDGNLQGGQDRLDSRDEDRLRQLDDELNGGSGTYVPYTPKKEINPLFWIIPALLGTFALILSFFWLRAFRGLSPAAQWYGRMTRASRVTGLTRASHATTPYELAAAVGQRLPGSRESATLIAEHYAAERYASSPPDATEITKGRDAWLRVRRLMLRSLLPRNRRAIKTTPQAPPIRPRGRRGR